MKYLRNLYKCLFSTTISCNNKHNNDSLIQYASILNNNFDPTVKKKHLKPKYTCKIESKDFFFKDLSVLIKDSTQLILNSFEKYKHSNVYLSFNGGKDSVVSFHLYRLASHTYASLLNKQCKLQAVYFKDPDSKDFPEITEFIDLFVKKYDIDLRVVESNWNQGVKTFLNENLCFILGTRKVDEGCSNLKDIDIGNSGDFKFVRINPILNWTYGDIWNFLIYFQLEYCKLYDLGYTSIGSVGESFPNPHLKNGDSYLPAYHLDDWEYERSGRNKRNIDKDNK